MVMLCMVDGPERARLRVRMVVPSNSLGGRVTVIVWIAVHSTSSVQRL